MDRENSIAKIIAAADTQEAKLDAYCKIVLSHKEVLAWILKSCVKEFADCSIKDIAYKYIEGEPEISSETVHRNESIIGMSSEDTALNEGIVTYDLKFGATAPLGELSLIINVEAQNDFYPGYPIIKRGMYYCGRMISAQYGTEFASSHYEKLKKVYSIWICLNPPKNRMNTITRYSFKEENIVGDVHENELDYDLMAVTIICLGDEKAENSTGVLRMLEVLFSSEIEKIEKRDILRDEFGMTMTKKYEGEVSEMCNFSKGILEKGIKNANISNIKNLMKNLNFTAEQAMSAIGLDEKDKIYYISIIDEERSEE